MKNLLAVLIVLNISFTITLGVMFHQDREETKVLMLKMAASNKPDHLLHSEIEVLKRGNEQAFNMIISNQQFLNVALLKIHHFVEPHGDKFYNNCPDCQKEKGEIEQGAITLVQQSK
tara:strand:+ start:112 stop:462 length:351 start_codon:yes stop_codon:yes gene_type:complete